MSRINHKRAQKKSEPQMRFEPTTLRVLDRMPWPLSYWGLVGEQGSFLWVGRYELLSRYVKKSPLKVLLVSSPPLQISRQQVAWRMSRCYCMPLRLAAKTTRSSPDTCARHLDQKSEYLNRDFLFSKNRNFQLQHLKNVASVVQQRYEIYFQWVSLKLPEVSWFDAWSVSLSRWWTPQGKYL